MSGQETQDEVAIIQVNADGTWQAANINLLCGPSVLTWKSVDWQTPHESGKGIGYDP